MNAERISSRQLTWLIIATTISTATLAMPSTIIFECKQNAWLAVLIATIITVLIGILNLSLARRFPEQTISQYAQILLGNWLGRFVGVFYGLVCLVVNALAIRSFAQLFKIWIMPETPLWPFVLGLTLLAVYAAWQGLELVARVNDLAVPFTLLVLSILLLAALRDGEIYRGLPILEFDLPAIAKGSFVPLAYLSESFIILLLAPSLNIPKELKSSTFKGILLSGFILMIITQCILFVLGSFRASANLFPLLNIATELHVLDVFERLEPLLLSSWITITSIKMALLAYLFALSTSQALSLKSHKPLLLISLLALPTIALLPKSIGEHTKIWGGLLLFKILLPIVSILIPAILLIIAKVKNKHA